MLELERWESQGLNMMPGRCTQAAMFVELIMAWQNLKRSPCLEVRVLHNFGLPPDLRRMPGSKGSKKSGQGKSKGVRLVRWWLFRSAGKLSQKRAQLWAWKELDLDIVHHLNGDSLSHLVDKVYEYASKLASARWRAKSSSRKFREDQRGSSALCNAEREASPSRHWPSCLFGCEACPPTMVPCWQSLDTSC